MQDNSKSGGIAVKIAFFCSKACCNTHPNTQNSLKKRLFHQLMRDSCGNNRETSSKDGESAKAEKARISENTHGAERRCKMQIIKRRKSREREAEKPRPKVQETTPFPAPPRTAPHMQHLSTTKTKRKGKNQKKTIFITFSLGIPCSLHTAIARIFLISISFRYKNPTIVPIFSGYPLKTSRTCS